MRENMAQPKFRLQPLAHLQGLGMQGRSTDLMNHVLVPNINLNVRFNNVTHIM
jgi:hypothetical protein